MVGLLKSKEKPEGPVEYENTAEIEASAESVYRLLDFADPLNQRRQMGDAITDLGGSRTFDLTMAALPGIPFRFEIIEATPFSRYVFECPSSDPEANLVNCREEYTFEPISKDQCKLHCKTIAEFRQGLSLEEFGREVAMMGAGVADSQYKLKLQAEEGIDAVMKYEAEKWL